MNSVSSIFYVLAFSLPVLMSCGLYNSGESVSLSKRSLPRDASLAPGCTTTEISALEEELIGFYRATIWSVATNMNRCSQCHSNMQKPLFASGDLLSSLISVKPFLAGEPSQLENYSGNGHCGAGCVNGFEMREAINAFRLQEGKTAVICTTVPQVPSPVPSPLSSPLPSPLPSPTGSLSMVYDQACMRCHKLGNYDPSGASPDLSSSGASILRIFKVGTQTHHGAVITLSQPQLDALVLFVNQN